MFIYIFDFIEIFLQTMHKLSIHLVISHCLNIELRDVSKSVAHVFPCVTRETIETYNFICNYFLFTESFEMPSRLWTSISWLMKALFSIIFHAFFFYCCCHQTFVFKSELISFSKVRRIARREFMHYPNLLTCFLIYLFSILTGILIYIQLDMKFV